MAAVGNFGAKSISQFKVPTREKSGKGTFVMSILKVIYSVTYFISSDFLIIGT